jgi:hypothetical protein
MTGYRVEATDLASIDRQGDETFSLEQGVAVSAVTFFKGECDVEFIKKRTGQVLQANPWLAATWRKKMFHKTQLLYPKEIGGDAIQSRLDKHFLQVEINEPSWEEDYLKLMKALAPYLCKNGAQLLNNKNAKDVPFRVVVVTNTANGQGGKFLLLVSINHTLADGATFYKICAMLSEDGAVQALDPVRLGPVAFRDLADETMGKEARKLASKFWLTLNIIGSIISDAKRGKRREVLLSYVDKDFIRKEKERAAAEGKVSFVSTNDILTSLVLGKQVFQADIGLFEVDLRGRLPSCPTNKAGNYSLLLPVTAADVESPSLIRQSLVQGPPFTLKRPATDGQPFKRLYRSKCAAVSNWTALQQDIQLPGNCEPYLHLPMMNILGPSPFPGCLIFRPKANETGVLLISSKHGTLPAEHEAWAGGLSHMPKVMRK